MTHNQLSDEQKYVLENKGTEPPFSGALLGEKRDGMYTCAKCSTTLFSSSTKFDSGSGWPSFTKPADLEQVTLVTDASHGMLRTEVICKTCGGHLGHVFDDGPAKDGGQRYCINSLSLEFNPDEH